MLEQWKCSSSNSVGVHEKEKIGMKLVFAPKSMPISLVNFFGKKFSPYYWFPALLGLN